MRLLTDKFAGLQQRNHWLLPEKNAGFQLGRLASTDKSKDKPTDDAAKAATARLKEAVKNGSFWHNPFL